MAISTTSNNNKILAGAKKTQVLRLIMKSVSSRWLFVVSSCMLLE